MLYFLAAIGTLATLVVIWIWGYCFGINQIMKSYDEKYGTGSFRKMMNEIGITS